MIMRGEKPKYWEKKPVPVPLFIPETHTEYPGIEPGPPCGEKSVKMDYTEEDTMKQSVQLV
jgi:hypothetical protein